MEVSESNGLDLGSGCRGERAATRIATFIATHLPQWSDEEVFQFTRRNENQNVDVNFLNYKL